MAFDVYFGAHRERSRAQCGLARFTIDVGLAIVLAVLVTKQLPRFSVTRVEPPQLPHDRPNEIEIELVMPEPAPTCGGLPMSGVDEVEDIPPEHVP